MFRTKTEPFLEEFSETLYIKSFIEEVKKHPELWDYNLREYKDRETKRIAWISIARTLCTDFDEKDQKARNQICNKLCEKWRNLRDNFKKNLNHNKEYTHARQMSFLLEVVKNPEHTQSQSNNSNKANGSGPSLSSQNERSLTNAKQEVKSPSTNITKPTTSSQSSTITSNYNADEEANSDRAFFDSLMPTLNTLTEDQKLEFRCEVLNAIQRIRWQQNVTNVQTSAPIKAPQISQGNLLHRRWKALRRGFAKELNTQSSERTPGSGGTNRRKYKYFKQLTFLLRNVPPIKSSTNYDNTESSQDQHVGVQDASGNVITENFEEAHHPTESNPTLRLPSHRNGVSQIDLTSNLYADEEANSDRAFFESLIPSLNILTADQKLEFRCEVLYAIQMIRQQQNVTNVQTSRPIKAP